MTGRDSYSSTAEFYDHVVPYRNREDVDFYIQEAKTASGPVLEVGCGTGRILLPVARARIQAVGLDLSAEMLSVLREKLSKEPPEVQRRIRIENADMRKFDLGERYPLITVPFRAFQHMITVDDQMAALDCMRSHLLPQGRLVLDLFNPSLDYIVNVKPGVETGDEPEFTMPDGRRVLRRTRTLAQDRFNQVNDVELVYHVTLPDGHQEHPVHAFRMRYLFRFEAEHLLTRCGFSVDTVYSDFDRQPYGAVNPGELIFIAHRRD